MPSFHSPNWLAHGRPAFVLKPLDVHKQRMHSLRRQLLSRWSLALLGLFASGETLMAQSANLYTIPNQSAHFVRMPSRESSTEIDAVFHNPAGVVELQDGWHLSFNNQGLSQASSVSSDYDKLNEVPTEYTGVASSLIFPSVFAAWRKGRVAVTAGTMMVGGSGGATYNSLPEVDQGMADIIPLTKALAPLAAVDAQVQAATGSNPGYASLSDYRFDFASDGYGFSPGVQLGLSYQASKMFSVAFGARFVQQFVFATSNLTNVEIYNPNLGSWYAPGDYLRMVAMDPNLVAPFPAVLEATAEGLDEDLAPNELDMREYGMGLTPIVGIGIRPSERVNIGIRYEHNTPMTLTTTINDGKDAGGLFADGEERRADLPGFVSIGAGYQMTDRLTARIGARYMFDSNTDWEGRDSLINGNYYELSIAGQYAFGKKVLISAGYTYNRPSVDPEFQQETDYRLPGHTFAGGGAYAINDQMLLNLGMMVTTFKAETNTYQHPFGGNENQMEPYNLTLEKFALVAAIGLDWRLPFKQQQPVQAQ
jgi:long-chain fatty acid transport protein